MSAEENEVTNTEQQIETEVKDQTDIFDEYAQDGIVKTIKEYRSIKPKSDGKKSKAIKLLILIAVIAVIAVCTVFIVNSNLLDMR